MVPDDPQEQGGVEEKAGGLAPTVEGPKSNAHSPTIAIATLPVSTSTSSPSTTSTPTSGRLVARSLSGAPPTTRSTPPRPPRAAKLRVTLFLTGGAVAMGALLFVLVRAGRRHPSAAPSASIAPASTAAPSAEASSVEAGDAGAAADAATLSAEAADAAPPRQPQWRVSALSSDGTFAYVEGAVGHRPFIAALAAAGLPKSEVQRVIKAFADVKNLDHCNPKDSFAFAKDKQNNRLVAFEYAISPLEVWQARDKDGTLSAAKLDLRVETKRLAVGIAVGEDLRSSVVQAGLDDDLLKMLDDALDGHAELADLKAGALLRIVATEERVDGQFARYPSLDAVEYTPGAAVGGAAAPLRVYYYARGPAAERGKTGGFFDAKAQAPFRGGWRSPVPLARIASRFNPHRMHPVLHIVMPHNGVDFAAPPGTPIYASAAGVVKSAGDGGPCGNMVQIEHPRGLVSAYCHMQRFAPGLHAGEHVDARQLIGYVGQSGRATGPHLHFAIRRGDIFVDPLAFKLDGMRVVPPALRDDFVKVRTEMDAVLDGIALPPPVAVQAAPEGAPKEDTVFDDSPGLE